MMRQETTSPENRGNLSSKISYDWDAIQLALGEGVSGTGLSTRGIGLFGVVEDMRQTDRQLVVHSGQGILNLTGSAAPIAERAISFPGTLVNASIPT